LFHFVVLIENFFMHLWNLANPLDFFSTVTVILELIKKLIQFV
jgi:hypothetical protein